ncbi:TrkA, K+ transport system, NAD-binding component [Halapricum desulfuricans]|uniref:TrkA, K+ transport system, NAD-binding component n=1 Tax=Halapricum desulfuricans TaxID=2841257 RepID=A0A897NIZ1_9EURY|nr:cation:proton antiporter [Halapricum desulfuricans]QSG12291.1 TrkA, K+ transport system, NAD-binding component [Halapricum desulfuricans]
MSGTLLPVVAAILILGIGVQLIARRLRVPSVVFYLAAGVLLGPEGLGLVTLETFGDGLEVVVGLAVAIIVFDGAFALQFDRVREASRTSLRLVTVGAVVMFLGTALAVRLLTGAAWEIALLVGALLVATGPTVITPILEVVRVREHVAAALETEGIVNDVTAAIGAVVIFETLLLDDLGLPATLLTFLERLGIGVAAGLIATAVIYALLEADNESSPDQGVVIWLIAASGVGSASLAGILAFEARVGTPDWFLLGLATGAVVTAVTAGLLRYDIGPEQDGRVGLAFGLVGGAGAVVLVWSLVTGTLAGPARPGLSLVAGAIVAWVVFGLFRSDVAPGTEPQAARFLTIVAAIGSFALAETVAAEAGIAAAATAGIALGNLELPQRELMEEFGRDATLLVLAFVFVSLAALIDFDAIADLGVAGVALAATVILVLRPIVAVVATAGVDQFTRPERLFLAAVGPRGIIPASVATLFAIELATAGSQQAAQVLLGTVFVVILATVAIEAGLARQIGDLLGVTPMRTILVGGGRVGRALATRLDRRGEFVVIVEDDETAAIRAREAGFTVHEGDGTESDILRAAGIEDAKIVVAATGDDDVNALVTQLAATKFDVGDIYARVNRPENVDAFDSERVTAIDSSMAAAYAIDNEIERPELAHWMTDIGDSHDIQQVEVTADELVGRSIRELNDVIPGGCLVAEVGRGEDARVPGPDYRIEAGEVITFLGSGEAVSEAVRRFHPHD